jgi:hypothetical protein
MALLERVAVIAYFVGGPQLLKSVQEWIIALGREVQEDLQLDRELEQGFF